MGNSRNNNRRNQESDINAPPPQAQGGGYDERPARQEWEDIAIITGPENSGLAVKLTRRDNPQKGSAFYYFSLSVGSLHPERGLLPFTQLRYDIDRNRLGEAGMGIDLSAVEALFESSNWMAIGAQVLELMNDQVKGVAFKLIEQKRESEERQAAREGKKAYPDQRGHKFATRVVQAKPVVATAAEPLKSAGPTLADIFASDDDEEDVNG